MKTTLTAISLLALLLTAVTALAAPELTVEQGKYNFGTITQGKKVQHNFTVKNTGDAPLQIRQLIASCGCTAAKPSTSTIAPGKTGQIQVTFDSANFSGRVEKSVTMTTNAGRTPSYIFYLDGTIEEQLQVVPRQLAFAPATAGVTKMGTITVSNKSGATVRLLSVKVNSTSMQIKPEIKKSELKPGETGTIEVAVTPKAEAKVWSGYLHIMTTFPQRKEITVPVYASPPR
ncbi:DUF1573 domain-containing protein [Geomonas sp. Red32]|uniref:DUF1573 domain-containing protein n=1 Tax=Geomonas sp. Red32 TaxID=2912856 RepID=UPI00202CC2C8|nr:DUF1573 domain-containing protein [Geomonas sp. Red32]MCM0082211.1 DUF1573 domain-containing protein [Geomonas sp. Red32]